MVTPMAGKAEDPVPSLTWDLVIVVLAAASLVPIFWVELEQLEWPDPRFKILAAIDLAFVTVFAGDLAHGWYHATDRKQWWRQHWYELPGLLPLYLEALALMRVVQLLRFARLLRLVRGIVAFRRLRALRVLDVLINRNKMLHTSLVAAVVVMALASVVWLLERDTNPNLASFGDALWWAIVTTTTVGYGDITPQTGLARFVATGLMLMGIGLIAVLASSWSAALIMTDEEDAREQTAATLPQQLEQLAALHSRGDLTADEFSAAKHKILA